VTDRQWVTAAASSLYSTPRDMARYLAALLGSGANAHGAVLQPATLRTMFAPHYQTDPRVPGMGLGFSRATVGGHLAVEHQGILPGFNAQIWVAPDDGVGVMGFTTGARNAIIWLTAETAGLLRQQLGVPDDVIRTDVPQRPDLWGDLCGRYQWSAAWTDLQARALLGLGAEVVVRRGQLMLRMLSPLPVLYRGFPLHPDDTTDPYVFRIDLSQFGMGTCRIVFSQEPGVGTTGVHTDLMPLALRKHAASQTPSVWLSGALGALAVVAAAKAVRRAQSRPPRELMR
jgi:hypothetical protein